jgi:hypothetical protein
MSIVIVTPDCYETIRSTVVHLRSQKQRERLELVIVAPSREKLGLNESEVKDFFQTRIVEAGPIESTAKARAAGIRLANAPIVAFVEDHSYPGLGWVEALIETHRKPWAAVGPVLLNANPKSVISWMNLLIEYGPWLDPVPGGVASHLPGHNSSYKREILLGYGPMLETMLEAESLLHWDLRARGYRLYLEPNAKIFHINFSSFFPSMALRFYSGRLFASQRSLHWSSIRRLCYVAGSPLIPLVRFLRLFREARQPGRRQGLPRWILPALLMGLLLDGAGEMIGYASGMGDGMGKLTDIEFHRDRYLNRGDKQKRVKS